MAGIKELFKLSGTMIPMGSITLGCPRKTTAGRPRCAAEQVHQESWQGRPRRRAYGSPSSNSMITGHPGPDGLRSGKSGSGGTTRERPGWDGAGGGVAQAVAGGRDLFLDLGTGAVLAGDYFGGCGRRENFLKDCLAVKAAVFIERHGAPRKRVVWQESLGVNF